MRLIRLLFNYSSLPEIVSSRVMSTFNSDSGKSEAALLTMKPDSDRVALRITFRHNSNEKVFSLNRHKSETLEVAFARLRLNLERFINIGIKRDKWQKKPSSGDVAKVKNSLVILLVVDGRIVNIKTPHHQAWVDNSILVIGDTKYTVLLNSPLIESIRVSSRLLTGYMTYPIINISNGTIDDCSYSWYRKKVKKGDSHVPKLDCDSEEEPVPVNADEDDWGEVISTGFIYYLKEEDIGHYLMVKVTPNEERLAGLNNCCVSADVVHYGPVDCPFIERQKFTTNRTGPGQFRIITYNLLADYYTSMKTTVVDIFPYCPSKYLNFNYRKLLLIKEIIGYQGDIICLQEVDRKFFDFELSIILSKSSEMEGFFTRKAGRDIQVPEGVATFYRRDKFKLIESANHDLTDLCLTADCLKNFAESVERNSLLQNRLLERNTIVQYILLETVDEPGKGLLVVNTHLYSNPGADHIRLLQGSIIVTYVEQLLRDYSIKYPHLAISPVFSGDFNSDPVNGVYKLYTNGFIESDHVDWRSVPQEAIEGLEVRHSLQLTSAYGTPEFTNFTEKYVGCLDYIFFDNQSLQLDSIVPLLSREQLSQQTAIPSHLVPSDHLALIAVIKWK